MVDHGNENEIVVDDPVLDDTEEEFSEDGILSELVGPGKKFKTIDDLVIGKLEADRFIEQLKRENRQLREELKKQKSLVEMMEELRSSQPSITDDNPVGENGADKDNRNVDVAVNKEDDIEKKILNVFEKLSREQRRQQNFSMIMNEYQKAFGDKAEEVFKKKVMELGLDGDALNVLLEKSPVAVKKLFEVDETVKDESPKPMGDPERVSVKQDSDKNVSGVVSLEQAMREGAPKSFWDKLRKENKRLYLTPKVQQAISRSAVKLGDAFWDN